MINPSIFKAYDIRGVYPRDINEDNIVTIVRAIYTFFTEDLEKEKLSIVLGRDMRISSPALFNKAKETLLEMGATVIDVGLVSTPTFYFAILGYGFDCGIQISASHNPKEYNGIKFARRNASKLIKIGKTTGMERVKEIAENESFTIPVEIGESIIRSNMTRNEVTAAFEKIGLPQTDRKLKIVCDPGNAMGALYIEEIFKRLPSFNLIKINFDLDGNFPAHQPDPLQFDTLKELQKKVIEEKADFGIAPDGDGDRVFFIDENGQVVPSTLISSLIATAILKKNPEAKIIVDIRYTRNVKAICQKFKAALSLSKVGHALITEQLNVEGASFAGESSGHFYFKETGGAESAALVILYVLKIILESNEPFSEILKEVSSSYESGEINFIVPGGVQIEEFLKKLAQQHKDAQTSWLDGLAVDYPDWRFNIRTSNTEPLMRLNLEANSKDLLEKNLRSIFQAIEGFGATRK